MMYDNLNSLLSRAMVKGVSPEMREALSVITDDMIEDKNQKAIFKAIKDLDNFNTEVSFSSVDNLVKDIVPIDVLINTARNTVPTDQPLRCAMQIASLYNDQKATHELKQIASLISSGRPFDRNELSNQLSLLSQSIAPVATSKPKSFKELALGYVDVLERRQENPGANYLDIGTELKVDKTALIVLGGQPGMGKTSLALYINDYVSRLGKKTLMFSLEMSDGQLFERQVSAYSKIPTQRLKNIDYGENDLSELQWGAVCSSVEQLSKSNVWIDDDPALSVPVLLRKCRDFKEQNPDLALITIDYLTLMKLPESSRRDLSVGEATRLMKLLAKELKTPVLLLSQLNREADKAAREPRNSDLRDSGSIEQDADVIIFPYREEVHIPDSVNKGLAKIIHSKVRDGETFSSVLAFQNGNFCEFAGQWRENPVEEKQERKKF